MPSNNLFLDYFFLMALKLYNFKCICGTVFEAMVAGTKEADEQIKKGLLSCPVCESVKVVRIPTAARIKKSSGSLLSHEKDVKPEDVENAVKKVLSSLANSCEDVGERFVEEVRSIKQGTSPSRPVKGTAKAEEVRQLLDEGIPVFPVPEKKTVN